ncbi:MAG: sulfite exporter TauE/SafE family protein [Thermoleophilaceae bacterium]|nr:sulfite exporter TauE/SafE family protein [Thermoleophilaceae bacterium]
MDVLGLVAIGFAAGLASGMVGIGGGVIFVPGLVIFADLGQVDAQATSLFAVIAVVLVGAWRQHGYGNVRLRDAMVVGALSPLGVVVGVVLANEVPERALEVSFALVQVYFAYRLVRRKPEAVEPV